MPTHGSFTTSTSFVDRLVELRVCAFRFVAPRLALPLLSAPARRLLRPRLEFPELSAPARRLRRPRSELPELSEPTRRLPRPRLELPLLSAPAVAHFSKKQASHNFDLGVATRALLQALHKGGLAAAVNGIRVQGARRSCNAAECESPLPGRLARC